MEIGDGISIPLSNSRGANQAPVALQNDGLPQAGAELPPDDDYVPYVPQAGAELPPDDDYVPYVPQAGAELPPDDDYVPYVPQAGAEPIYEELDCLNPHALPPTSPRFELRVSGKPPAAAPDATGVENAESSRTRNQDAPGRARFDSGVRLQAERSVEEKRRDACLLDAFDAADGDTDKFREYVRERITVAALRHPIPSPVSPRLAEQAVAGAEASHDEVDLPNHHSHPPTSDRVETQASRRLALTTLQAVGVANPESELVRIYRQQVPEETRFDREVRSQVDRHEEAMKQEAYLRSAFWISGGNKDRFANLIQQGTTETLRHFWGGQTYRRLSEQIEPFVRPTPQEYLQSFNDLPGEIHDRVHREAVEFALDHAFAVATA